mmetsp:Transcript_9994/g.23112  ORF Transcript_9994/g.23112 Transcript_9994/m.23112 type:complete len:128 (+) Transcript_9994:537-920(+)
MPRAHPTSIPHRDIIEAIKHELRISPINWKWRHIKGHQDLQKTLLDKWEPLNVAANELAKCAWSPQSSPPIFDTPTGHGPCPFAKNPSEMTFTKRFNTPSGLLEPGDSGAKEPSHNPRMEFLRLRRS